MKRERGSEQHAEPVWKHERGEKGEKKGKGLWEGDDGCWHEAERSRRREDTREVGKVESVEGKTDTITKETARTVPCWGECVADKEEKEQGRKGVGGRREGEEEEYRMNANREPKLSTELYPSQAEEQQSQTHFLSPWP